MKKNKDGILVQFANFGIGPIVGMFISMLTVPVTTRMISPEEFGKSSLFSLVQTIFNLVVLLGVDQSYVRFYNQKDIDKKQLLQNCLFIPLCFCLLVIVFTILFYKQISIFMFGQIEKGIMFLFLFFLPAMLFNRFALLSIRMDLRGKTYSFLNIFQQVVNFSVLILLLIFYEKTFRSIVYAAIISTMLNTVLAVILSKRFIPFSKIHLEKKLLKEIILFGLPLVPATALSWVMNSFDKVALRTWSSFEELGLYAAAFKIVSLLNVFQTIFTTTWTPLAYKWYEEKVPNEKFEDISSIMIGLMTFIFAGIIVFRDIIMLLLGPEYRGTANIFVFLLFSPVMYTVSETTSQGIGFAKKTIYSLYISIISAVMNIVGNYLLVPKYGAQGAAISTCICYIVFFWARTLFSRKVWFKFKLNKFFINIFVLIIYGINMLLFKNKLIEVILLTFVVLYNGYGIYKIFNKNKALVNEKKEL